MRSETLRERHPTSPKCSKKDWQSQVKELAAKLGYKRAYHTFDSRRSDSGFPDLVLVRDRVIYLELKREKGKLSDSQIEWLTALVKARAEVYVARPRHLQLLAQVLGRRYRIVTPLAEETCRELSVSPVAWLEDGMMQVHPPP